MIKNLDDRNGAKAYGRRKNLSPQAIVDNALSTTLNLVAGRHGQVAIVDKVRVSGVVGNPQGDTAAPWAGIGDGYGTLRALDYSTGAFVATDSLPLTFWRPAVNSANVPIYTPISITIDKFGWVPRINRDANGRDFPASIQYIRVDPGANMGGNTTEVDVEIRWGNLLGDQAHSIKPGSWGGVSGLVAGTSVLAAPGVGYYWRIHTIVIEAVGGAFAGAPAPLNETIALSDDANVTQLMSWRVTSAFDRGRVEFIATDIDWPCRENAAITFHPSAGLNTAAGGGGNYSVLIGAERCPITTNPFVNLTGTPA